MQWIRTKSLLCHRSWSRCLSVPRPPTTIGGRRLALADYEFIPGGPHQHRARVLWSSYPLGAVVVISVVVISVVVISVGQARPEEWG